MTSPLSAETAQHALVTLWHETTQAHFHLLLKAELSWIERAISVLRERGSHPNEDRENTDMLA